VNKIEKDESEQDRISSNPSATTKICNSDVWYVYSIQPSTPQHNTFSCFISFSLCLKSKSNNKNEASSSKATEKSSLERISRGHALAAMMPRSDVNSHRRARPNATVASNPAKIVFCIYRSRVRDLRSRCQEEDVK
jgi:hypothetical protein